MTSTVKEAGTTNKHLMSASRFHVQHNGQLLSQSSTAIITSDHTPIMSAVTTVFETYELLESIIACLPPRSIRNAGAVAQSWHHLTRRSARIRRARCIVPTGRSPYISHHDCIGHPTYSPSCTVLLHPVLNGMEVANDTSTVLVFEVPETLEACAGRGSAYATEPPCSVLYVYLADDHDDTYWHEIDCMVQVQEGVRLSDLVTAANGMLESFRRYDAGVLVSGPEPQSVRGQLEIIRWGRESQNKGEEVSVNDI